MLVPALDALRLSLHVLAAAVWVGGQLTLGGLVPAVQPGGPELVRGVARRFAMLAWPAFVVLVGTGLWNMAAVHVGSQSGSWRLVLWVKLGFVGLSGAAAYLHGRVRSRGALALWGALSALAAVVALGLGVTLGGEG